MDPAAYIDTCLYLYCSLPPTDRGAAVCDTLASYARECAQQHIIITWRTADLCGTETKRSQCKSVKVDTPNQKFSVLFHGVPRSCLSQGSGVLRLRVLLSPHLYLSSHPRASFSHGTMQGGVCGWLRVSVGPLPSPGTLSEKRRLSLFPSETHIPVGGQDTAEMQHLVRLLPRSPFVFYTVIAVCLLYVPLIFPACAELASGSALGRNVRPNAAS